MKIQLHRLLACLALVPAALIAADQPADAHKGCTCDPCACKGGCHCADKKADGAKHYPLKGVIVDLRADQSSLVVKHEDIPGFMPAMTMSFKVDAATLKSAQKGQSITATLVHHDGEFSLENVKPVGH